jgi:hypothetical protein
VPETQAERAQGAQGPGHREGLSERPGPGPVQDPSESAGEGRPSAPSFRQALAFWWRLGFISFGGPAGQIALMHDEIVTRRRWLSEGRFLHALNYCMLLPGPEAQQLATYLGWLMHRTWGGVAAGVLFVLPSLFILIALSWVYLDFGHLPAIAGFFYGIKPAVTARVSDKRSWPPQRFSLNNVVVLNSLNAVS